MATVKQLNETTYEVTVIKSGEEFKHFKEHILTHFKDAKVDGFRPGKVPASVIEKTFKNEINNQILNHIISDAYKEAVLENNLRPVADIKLEKFDTKEDSVEVVFTIPVLPEIKLGDYRGIKIEKEIVSVSDEKVNEEIERIRTNAGKLKELDEDAVAELNDVTNIDFEGFIDGVAFDGGKSEGMDLTLGSKSFIDTFEEQIVGHKKGDEFDVTVSFPENYGVKNLAGKPAVFKVKVNSIKRKEEAELNDELAKEQGFESLEDLREKTRENIIKREEARAESEFIGKVVEAVVDDVELEVPVPMVDNEIQYQINRLTQQIQMQGINLNQYLEMTGQTMEQLQESLRRSAVKSLKTDLILSEIARIENIQATESEINEEINKMAAMYGMDRESIIADIRKDGNYENFMTNINYQIVNKKTVDMLANAAR